MKKLLKSAKRGNTFSQYLLGNLYFRGIGVEQDYHEALQWYRSAAVKGDSSSQFRLGLMYINGSGVAQDYAEAMRWLKKAALHGNSAALLYFELYANSGDTLQQSS